MPTFNLVPGGISGRIRRSSMGNDAPMSRPYAPVSSLVSHTSTTPSARVRAVSQHMLACLAFISCTSLRSMTVLADIPYPA